MPQALPTFAVSSRQCTVTGSGGCFRSPNYPNDYGSIAQPGAVSHGQDCAITVSGAGLVRATAFGTQSGFDYVIIDGTRCDDTGQELATTGVAVSDGGTVSWDTGGWFGTPSCAGDGIPCQSELNACMSVERGIHLVNAVSGVGDTTACLQDAVCSAYLQCAQNIHGHGCVFEVCGFDACGQHGSSGGGTTCVCIGGYTGAQCKVRLPHC